MAFSCLSVLDVVFGVTALYFLKYIITPRPKAPLPPGPKGLPIVGNVADMPSEKEWLTFSQWGKQYGGICSVTILGQTIVILNSAKIAADMLDKKSSIYSDRPVLQMGGELVGWKNTLVLLPYGDRLRRFRKHFHNLIGTPATMKRFHPAEEIETKRFLRRLLLKPDDLSSHIRRATGAIILRISYGYEVKEDNDPFVSLADRATEQFAISTVPGLFMVDMIPALRHIPEWVPGASFKRKAREWSSTLSEMVEQPYNFVKQQMSNGTAEVSFTSAIIEEKQLNTEEEFDLKWSAASLYSGGADTTVSALYAFFLAMTMFPDVAKKAQKEIDRVVGSDRLPSFQDRDDLPYIDAVTKEVFRWNSVVPTVPHRVTQDDIHEGYFIPKGAIILANIWHMTHDENIYKDPMVFNPDRFLSKNGSGRVEPDPRELSFGFGRRICPGLHFADSSVFIMIATTLAVCDISKRAENGSVIQPVHESSSGTISHPKPFKCAIKPRSEKAIALMQEDTCGLRSSVPV